MRTIQILIILVIAISSQDAISGDCLKYEPNVVSLTGRIARQVFPGRPNYESIAKGDEPEVYWILKLYKPICAKGVDELEPQVDGVLDLQLLMGPVQYSKYESILDKVVVVRGKLSLAMTGHHHTDLLFSVVDISEAVGKKN